jgi:hypothetical protein
VIAYDDVPMRTRLLFVLAASLPTACALFVKSPALSSPLRDQLAKADTPTIEDASKACLRQGGWTPDDVGGESEGASVVSAKNAAKARVTVYVQPPGTNPRVTGDPAYDDPFWACLGRELAGTKAGPASAPSAVAR